LKPLKEISLFIVAGRTGHSLIVAKALPFSVLDRVKTIYIFSESEGFAIPKCIYVTVPNWIRKTKPVFLRKIIRFLFEPFQLLFFTIKLNPDFINGIYCLPKGLNSYIISRLTGIKCFNSIIGSVLEIESELPFKWIWRNINIWQLRGCEAVTIKGERDKKYLLSKGIKPEKMFPFNGAIDTERFFFDTHPRTIDLLFVGNFYELKGPDRIVRIVHLLLTKFPDIKIVMVGEGKMLNATKSLALSLGINNISFEGYQKNTVPYFQKSKLLIMPSRSDSLPTSMIEAMSCGCVPVISDVGNVTEAARNNINSKVIENYLDLNGFAAAVTELLTDEAKRMEFAINARKMVEEFYSVKSQSILAENIINYLDIK
jgi:glycosyltransferase involved in cell wall biosynthesis